MSSKYNGWTNFETWNFNLWITNEESDYNHALELAEDSKDEYELSKRLKEWAVDMAENCLVSENCFIVDVVYMSISEVNFYEVAEHLWEERQEAVREGEIERVNN